MNRRELRHRVMAEVRADSRKLESKIRRMPLGEQRFLDELFMLYALDGQVEPEGDWRVWLLMAGRGYGKTRAGAEWVSAMARAGGEGMRIALVGASIGEVARVMIEGDSGLIAVRGPKEELRWKPSRGVVTFPSGAQAFAFSAHEPDGLRGPQHHYAWTDELAKWANADETWDNLMLGLRLGERPRVMVTTTPRHVALLDRIMALPRMAETRGKTLTNHHLPIDYRAAMSATYGGTRLGRQELDGELIRDVENSLWPRELIEKQRRAAAEPGGGWARVVIGVDPPAGTNGDACGIVVAALDRAGIGHVLADRSVAGERPEGWARAVARAAEEWGADRVIAEANNGGAMVESVLRAARTTLPVKLVSARRGKSARAEPVAALFETGRAVLAGTFPELEDELTGLVIGGGYKGPGRSPDRADAMVWAMTALMLTKEAGEPRVRVV